MAIFYKLYRYDLQFFRNKSGSQTEQIPASALTAVIRKQGATVSSNTGSGGSGVVTIPVYDPGAIVVGDQIQIGTSAVTGIVSIVNATSIVTSSTTGAFVFDQGSRVVATAAAAPFADNQASVSAGALVSGSQGAIAFYAREPIIDYILTGATINPTLVIDEKGKEVEGIASPYSFGMKQDGVATDTASLRAAVAYAIAKGRQEILLKPGLLLIDNEIDINGATLGLKIRGAGRGLTTIRQTNNNEEVFRIRGSSVDVEICDMTLEGSGGLRSAPLITEQAGTSGLALRRLRLVDGTGGLLLQGDDSTTDDVIFSGTVWTGNLINVSGGNRAHLTSCRGRIAGNFGAGILLSGGSSGTIIQNADITHSSGAGIGLSITGTPVDTKVSSSRFNGGAGFAGVNVAAARGLSLENVTVIDSGYGFYLEESGGTITDVMLRGCRALRSTVQGFNLISGSHIRLHGCLASDSNQAAASNDHMLISGTISDVEVQNFRFGNFANGSGADARDGIRLEAGAGTRIQIMGTTGDSTSITGLPVNNQKDNTANGIYISHNYTPGGIVSAEHDAVGLRQRSYTNNDTTPSVANTGYLSLSYGAGITVTNFDDATAGQLLLVKNIGVNNITFQHNTAALISASGADRVLGQNDLLAFIKSVGTVWLEIGFGNV